MADTLQIYKCDACGSIIEVLNGGDGELVCCDQPMVLMTENTVDAAKEKHVPVIEKVDGGIKVMVGSVPHPWKKSTLSPGLRLSPMVRSTGNFYAPVLMANPKPFLISKQTKLPRVNIATFTDCGNHHKFMVLSQY